MSSTFGESFRKYAQEWDRATAASAVGSMWTFTTTSTNTNSRHNPYALPWDQIHWKDAYHHVWPTFSTGTIHLSVDYDPPPDKEPIYEYDNMPILAQRYAGLKISNGRLWFLPVNSNFGKFGVDEDAICKARSLAARMFEVEDKVIPHAAPSWGCRCGFYAVPADKLPNFNRVPNQVVLQVELSGKIIIHDSGYRAEHQKVLEVFVPHCDCGESADVIQFDEKTRVAKRFSCKAHSKTLIVEEWFQETVPQYYESNQGAIGRALDSMHINYDHSVNLTLAEAAKLSRVRFTRFADAV